MKKLLISTASVALLALSSQAQAATATTTFQSKVIITATCAVAATILDFGTTGVIAANLDLTSTINVTCTNTTPYTVAVNQGIMGGGTVTTRKMKVLAANTEAVSYSLFRDAARTLNWGVTAGTDTVAGTGNGLAQPLTVYGRIPAQAAVTPGTYTDTLTVTVTY
jgi:spore coat protein U-like protein